MDIDGICHSAFCGRLEARFPGWAILYTTCPGLGLAKPVDERGVNVALITDSPILSEESLYHHIGEAVREGVPYLRALRMVTINPAHVLGVEDRVGTLREGKDADLILVKGRPGLDTDASVCKTMIDGKVIWQSVS